MRGRNMYHPPVTNAEKACDAIAARINGVWDNASLVAFGALSTNLIADIQGILEFYGVG
jgi:hypothetical protein